MKTILLKVSGTILSNHQVKKSMVTHFLEQLKSLIDQGFRFGIVIGGGNFFRGSQEEVARGLRRSTADTIGMLATVMNGLMLYDLCYTLGIKTHLLNTVHMPQITRTLNQQTLDHVTTEKIPCIIFAGGTANPYFSTDTNAIIRAFQIGATEVWKGTNVDFIYSADPAKESTSMPLKAITYDAFVQQKLGIMDLTAVTLAQTHQLPVRVFNLFKENGLLNVATDKNFGSTISSS